MSLLSNNKIIIHLDSYAFVAGDTIRGNLEIVCSEPVKADGVSIGLNGTHRQNNISISYSGGMGSENSVRYFFSQKITLLWPGEYTSQMVPFTYSIPSGILPKRAGLFDNLWDLPPWALTLLNILMSLIRLQQSQSMPEFTLEARIDIPWGIDITERIPVSIEQKPAENLNPSNILSPDITNELNK